MAYSHTGRCLAALERLACTAEGASLARIAAVLKMPKSGAHRLMAELIRLGHVAVAIGSSAPGMSALAAPVRHPASGAVLGTVSIGGPSTRIAPDRIAALSPALLAAAADLSDRVAGSAYFTAAPPAAN